MRPPFAPPCATGSVALPPGPPQDLATSLQRQALAFSIRRPIDDAFNRQPGEEQGGRLTSSKRSRRWAGTARSLWRLV
jgi:hypothetical protein